VKKGVSPTHQGIDKANSCDSHLWRTIVLTGIDVIVVLFALMAIAYAASPGKESEMKLEPLTLLIVGIVLAMMIVSMT
jgi:hypothetical protein